MDIICEKCKKSFFLGLSSMGGSATFLGGINATCPKCGHVNVIPASKIEFDKKGDVIKASLIDEKIPEADLLKFVTVIKSYIGTNKNQDDFEKDVKAINPKLQKILGLAIPKTSSDFYAILGFLLILVTTFLTTKPSVTIINKPNITNKIVNQKAESTLKQTKDKARVQRLKRKKKKKNQSKRR